MLPTQWVQWSPVLQRQTCPNFAEERDIISIIQSEKKSASMSQGCLLDKYPWKESRTKGITRRVKNKMENCPSAKYFNRTSLFTIRYLRIHLLKCTCNPKINTCHTFTCRPGQSGKKLSGLTLRFPAKAKQGDSRPSCFSSYTVNKCLFCCILSVMFFAFLCTFFSNFAI